MLSFVGEDVPLSLVLGDYATDLYPRVRVYLADTLVDSVDLTHVANGYYTAAWEVAAVGTYSLVYDVYTDAGHTTLSDDYEPAMETLQAFAGQVAEESGAVRQAYTLDPASNTITVSVWVEIDGTQVTSGLSNAALTLFYADGTTLSTPAAQVAPEFQGVFLFEIAPAPSFPLGETATVSLVTIDFDGPPARTLRGVTGVTFSRGT